MPSSARNLKIIFTLFTLLSFLFSVQAAPSSSTGCSEDQYIPLAYPNELKVVSNGKFLEKHKDKNYKVDKEYLISGIEQDRLYKEGERPAAAPPNTGYIWIPKEACGKNVDLLIALHGWRGFDHPGDNVYLDGIPGGKPQKSFDGIIRRATDNKQSVPIVVAAPMHDLGPDETAFMSGYDVNEHIKKIKEAVAKAGINLGFTRVSLIGHSNANCGGGLAAAAKALTGYPLYFYGAADGTCGSDYIDNILPTLKNKGTILFHVHQARVKGDIAAAETIKKESGVSPDPSASPIHQYDETWKSNDGKLYSYLIKKKAGYTDFYGKSRTYTHTEMPQVLLEESLPRFFSPTGTPPTAAPPAAPPPGLVTPSKDGGSAASQKQVGGFSDLLLAQKCLSNQRCQEIDEVWQRIAPVLGHSSDQVWVPGRDWQLFGAVYQQKVAPLPSVPSVPSTTPAAPALPSTTLGTLNLEGCSVTTSIADSQSVGNGREGKLINGIKPNTNSFINHPNNRVSEKGTEGKVEYGTLELIQMLELTSCALQKQYNVKLYVRDRSLQEGGIVYLNLEKWSKMPPKNWRALSSSAEKYDYSAHISHQSGREVDIGYFYFEEGKLKNELTLKGCGKKTCEKAASSQFTNERALEANWFLLKTMNKIFPVDRIFFDKYLITELQKYACNLDVSEANIFFGDCDLSDDISKKQWVGILKHLGGHADHYHLNIKCPIGDTQCTGSKADRVVSGIDKAAPSPAVSSPSSPAAATTTTTDGLKTITFNSEKGNDNRKVAIVTSTTFDPRKPSPLYFFFGSSGSNPNGIIEKVNKKEYQYIDELAKREQNFILVIPQISSLAEDISNFWLWIDNPKGHGDFNFLFNEVIDTIKEKLGGSPSSFSSLTLAAYSAGGAAIKNILISDPSPSLTKLVFIDACSGNWCQEVKDKKGGAEMIVVQNKRGDVIGNPGDKLKVELGEAAAVTTIDASHGDMFPKYFNRMYSE